MNKKLFNIFEILVFFLLHSEIMHREIPINMFTT